MRQRPLIEGQFKSGAIRHWALTHWWNRSKRQIVKGVPDFNWITGFNVENTVGIIPIKNQGQNDSCGGQSGSYLLHILAVIRGIVEAEYSAKSVYSPIAYPGGGTTVAKLEGQISSGGANLESEVPSYDATNSPLPEPQMADRSWETSALVSEASKRSGYTAITVPLDIDSVASYIQQCNGAIMEIEGQNGHTPGWLSSTPQPPVPDNGQPIFAHFMCLIGARMMTGLDGTQQKHIIALESMGNEVGSNGIQYFSEAYFQSGFVKDVFCFDWDGNIPVPAEPPQSSWPSLVWFFAGWEALKQLFASGAGKVKVA